MAETYSLRQILETVIAKQGSDAALFDDETLDKLAKGLIPTEGKENLYSILNDEDKALFGSTDESVIRNTLKDFIETYAIEISGIDLKQAYGQLYNKVSSMGNELNKLAQVCSSFGSVYQTWLKEHPKDGPLAFIEYLKAEFDFDETERVEEALPVPASTGAPIVESVVKPEEKPAETLEEKVEQPVPKETEVKVEAESKEEGKKETSFACPDCGSPVDADVAACGVCGTKLK